MKNPFILCLSVTVLVILSASASAQSRFSRLFSSQLGELEPQANYEMTAISSASVHNQDADVSFLQQDMDVFIPLRQTERFESAFTTDLQVMDLASRARLIDAGAALPDHLWDINFGGLVRGRLNNGWIAGLQAAFGSASNKPFDSMDENVFNATGFVQIPAENDHQHIFFLNFSSNREFLPYVPLPGYAYQWSSGRTLQALLGLPFSWARWSPVDKLSVQAAYVMPRTVHAKVSYEFLKGLEVYGGFDWQNQRWYRAGRADDDDRLMYYEKKASVGVQWQASDQVTFGVEGGYGFDRFFFEGEDYDDRGDSRISISDGCFLNANVGIRL